MRIALCLMIAVLAIGGERIDAARDAGDSPLPLDITVQIHDYVHLPPAVLSTASDVVSHVYQSIGVRTAWLAPLQQKAYESGGSPSHGSRAPSNPSRVPIAQITVLVLTPQMTVRGHIPEGILGFAAVATDGGIGRIAYVIYDRVREQASIGAIDERELFGLVMAHEIGHLLLGPGSQGEAGLMKGNWDREDLLRFTRMTPQFSSREADEIRGALGAAGSVGTAGRSH